MIMKKVKEVIVMKEVKKKKVKQMKKFINKIKSLISYANN